MDALRAMSQLRACPRPVPSRPDRSKGMEQHGPPYAGGVRSVGASTFMCRCNVRVQQTITSIVSDDAEADRDASCILHPSAAAAILALLGIGGVANSARQGHGHMHRLSVRKVSA